MVSFLDSSRVPLRFSLELSTLLKWQSASGEPSGSGPVSWTFLSEITWAVT